MDTYLIVKTVHILSSTILFGTGIGIAFFMFRSHFTANYDAKLYAIGNTVLADYLFTLPAAIAQPATGIWLIWFAGYDAMSLWLAATYALYAIAAACWLPVVWIQFELKKLLRHSIDTATELPARYHVLFRTWFLLGWPAFISLFIIFLLMVMKPT